MRPALIAIVGLAGLISVFLFQFYTPLLLVLLNSLAIGCILTGTLVPVPSGTGRMALQLRQDQTTASTEVPRPCLQGIRLNPDLQRFEFRLEPRGMAPLVFTGTLSLSAIAFAWHAHPNLLSPYSREDSGEFFVFFVCVFLSAIPLSIAVSWLMERLLLMRAVVTIGNLDPRSGAYNFADQNGATYGGTRKVMPIHSEDNICLVFYSQANPQFNKSSSGLGFHRVAIH